MPVRRPATSRVPPKTPPCDLDARHPPAQHTRYAPDQLSAVERCQYRLCRLKEPQVAERTCRMHRAGMRNAASIHPLRHASATHRLERGVSRRFIQARLGPQRLKTTARATPLTAPAFDIVHATITALRADLRACRSTRMPAVADVWRRDGPAPVARVGEGFLPSHRRAMDALVHGRTEPLGGPLWPCEPWGAEGQVGGRDQDAQSSRWHTMPLPAPACIRMPAKSWINWEQWRIPKTRYRKLVALGVDAERAGKATATGRGAWWNAGVSHMHAAMTNRLLAEWGLLSLLDQLRAWQGST